jgi:hypothetical protein
MYGTIKMSTWLSDVIINVVVDDLIVVVDIIFKFDDMSDLIAKCCG